MTVTKDGKLTTGFGRSLGRATPSGRAIEPLSRERLHEDAQKEQARVNGKKWKASDETPDEVRKRNVSFIVERLLRWTPIKLNGEDLPFSIENATKVLSDPRKVSLLIQALEFLNEDKSFIKRAATS
jgi:hypothetical protein